MTVPARLEPLLAQFDGGCERLVTRMAGPESDSGNGTPDQAPPLTDAEHWWVNQEVLRHGAEIALLRDLYRDRL